MFNNINTTVLNNRINTAKADFQYGNYDNIVIYSMCHCGKTLLYNKQEVMYMKCRARTSAIILLILMLCCSALAESVADDPIVVRVGKFSYPRSKVQASLDGALDFSEALLGDMPTEEEKASRLQIAIDSFIGLGLIENKLTEAGKNDFSEAEMEDMSQAANGKYDEFWQLVYDRMQKEDESVQEKDVTETMDSLGYTFQAFLDEYILQARQNRIIEMY